MGKEWEADMRIMIALAEAGWSRSFSWRVFEWWSWKMRLKYPLTRARDQIVNWSTIT
jgi:hypothetical protein